MRKTVIATVVKKEKLFIIGLRASGKSSYYKGLLEKDPNTESKYDVSLMTICASTSENAEFGVQGDTACGTRPEFSLEKNAKLLAKHFSNRGYGKELTKDSKVVFIKVDPEKYRTHKKYRNAVKFAINGGDYSFTDKSTKGIKEYLDNDECELNDEDFIKWITLLQNETIKAIKSLGIKPLIVDTVHATSVRDVINFWKNSKYSDFIED
jgi:hypothetical protein